MGQTLRSAILAEMVRAAMALAIIFFALSPLVTAGAASAEDGASLEELCGAPVHAVDHAPCHACRPDPVLLPAAPGAARDCAVAIIAAQFTGLGTELSGFPEAAPGTPRAPPLSIRTL